MRSGKGVALSSLRHVTADDREGNDRGRAELIATFPASEQAPQDASESHTRQLGLRNRRQKVRHFSKVIGAVEPVSGPIDVSTLPGAKWSIDVFNSKQYGPRP